MSVIGFQKLGRHLGGLCVVLVVLFGGCGGEDSGPAKPPQSAEAKQKFDEKIKEAAKSGLYGKNAAPPK